MSLNYSMNSILLLIISLNSRVIILCIVIFQARNVMLTQGSEPCFIDFQGGRKGPFLLRPCLVLMQASAQYNDELRAHLIEVYYQELKKWVAIGSFGEFKSNLNLFVLFRTLQVLGAYGFRGYIEEKSYFVRSIPFAINNLKALLQHEDLFKPYTYLKEVLEKTSKPSTIRK